VNVSVIVLHYGAWELTEACVAAVRATTDAELVMVCNSEAPDELDADILIRNPRNVGFARGCNQGARRASGDVLVFLNNDTVPEPGWLDAMVGWFDKPGTAAVGATLYRPDGEVHHAGVAVDFRQPPGKEAWEVTSRPRGQVQAVTGACMAVDAARFRAVDGFDEGYVNGYEDVDLCLSLTEDGGLIVYEPDARVMHHVSASGPERFAHVNQNVARLRAKWGNR
jgi:GT2 family glycosyltransferase